MVSFNMFGIAAIVGFVLSLIFEVAAFSKGHFDWQTAMLAGFTCLAIHLVSGWLPLRGRATPAV
jgi:hypothetical protein